MKYNMSTMVVVANNDIPTGVTVRAIWSFNTLDPMFYTLYLPAGNDEPPVKWELGRQLFRDAIDDGKIGGIMEALVMPPMYGDIQLVLSNLEHQQAMLLYFGADDFINFHHKMHEKVSAQEEIEFAMNELLLKVST